MEGGIRRETKIKIHPEGGSGSVYQLLPTLGLARDGYYELSHRQSSMEEANGRGGRDCLFLWTLLGNIIC